MHEFHFFLFFGFRFSFHMVTLCTHLIIIKFSCLPTFFNVCHRKTHALKWKNKVFQKMERIWYNKMKCDVTMKRKFTNYNHVIDSAYHNPFPNKLSMPKLRDYQTPPLNGWKIHIVSLLSRNSLWWLFHLADSKNLLNRQHLVSVASQHKARKHEFHILNKFILRIYLFINTIHFLRKYKFIVMILLEKENERKETYTKYPCKALKDLKRLTIEAQIFSSKIYRKQLV